MSTDNAPPQVNAPIGVFDSGIGGLSILRALRAELPLEQFVYVADSAYAPYGERDEALVRERALEITQDLMQQHHIKALVVACNTATAAAIAELRALHPQLPIVGVEPALKPAAAQSQSHHVGVLATRGTLSSAKYRALQTSLRDQARFIDVACDGLAAAIEADDGALIEQLCEKYVGALGHSGAPENLRQPDEPSPIDTVVLGCTHYPFVSNIISKYAGSGVIFLESGEPVARQTRRLLEAQHLLATGPGGFTLRATGPDQSLRWAARHGLGGGA